MTSSSRKISDIINSQGFVKGTNRYIGGIVTSRGGLSKAESQKKIRSRSRCTDIR